LNDLLAVPHSKDVKIVLFYSWVILLQYHGERTTKSPPMPRCPVSQARDFNQSNFLQNFIIMNGTGEFHKGRIPTAIVQRGEEWTTISQKLNTSNFYILLFALHNITAIGNAFQQHGGLSQLLRRG
jgi:hypothetical protein